MKNLGSATIKIDFTGGIITVYHGDDGDVLRQFKANSHSWGAIWSGIDDAENDANLYPEK